MSDHVILNLSNGLRKSNKNARLCLASYRFSSTSLMIFQHECKILSII